MKINISECIKIGLTEEATFHVQDEHMAVHVGSGSSRVLATPWMIAFMERASHRLMTACLPEGYTSVGIHVDVRHLAASPVGSTIRVISEVHSVDGLQVTFAVQAWDKFEKIGEGFHKRYVVDQSRFLEKVEAKRVKLDG
jgi:fluoroacetyl-CoA thioesterase